jgi:hypothetical protein
MPFLSILNQITTKEVIQIIQPQYFFLGQSLGTDVSEVG